MNAIKPLRRARAKKLEENRPYHHGDLHDALVRAADEVLSERGPAGFSLREAARRAGVSPAAPTYHFGNARGLLMVVVGLGIKELKNFIKAELVSAGDNPADRLVAIGRAYVRFAVTYPGRFSLIFSHEHRELVAPSSQQCFEEAFSHLREVSARLHAPTHGALRPNEPPIEFILAWSLMHGFAHLVLGGSADLFPEGIVSHQAVARFGDQMLKQFASLMDRGARQPMLAAHS